MGVFKSMRDLQKQAKEIEKIMPPVGDRMAMAQERMANATQMMAAQTQAATVAAAAAVAGLGDGTTAMRRTVMISGMRQVGMLINFDLLVEFELTVMADGMPPYSGDDAADDQPAADRATPAGNDAPGCCRPRQPLRGSLARPDEHRLSHAAEARRTMRRAGWTPGRRPASTRAGSQSYSGLRAYGWRAHEHAMTPARPRCVRGPRVRRPATASVTGGVQPGTA